MNIIIGYISTLTYVIVLLLICTYLNKKNLIKDETSRKLIHIFVSFCWIIMNYTVKDTIHQVIIPIIFIILNSTSYKFNLIKGMERSTNNSLGTIFYAISIELMALASYIKPELYPFYGMSVFVMAFGDGLAPIIAQHFKSPKILKTNKTINGSLTVLITTMLLTIVFKSIYDLNLNYIQCLLLAAISAVVELFSKKGIDNILVPLATFVVSYLMVM